MVVLILFACYQMTSNGIRPWWGTHANQKGHMSLLLYHQDIYLGETLKNQPHKGVSGFW